MKKLLIVLILFFSYTIYSQTAEEILEIGYEKRDNGDYDGAIKAFTNALDLRPKYASAYYARAFVKDKINDYQGSIADYNEFIKIIPDFGLAYNNRGLAKRSVSSDLTTIDSAIKDFEKAIEIEPNNSDFHFNRAKTKHNKLILYNSSEEFANEVIEAFTKCIEINPNDKEAWFYRGRTKMIKLEIPGISDFYTTKFSAFDDFTQAIVIDKDYGRAWFNRALNRVKGADKRKDRKIFKTACREMRIAQNLGDILAKSWIKDNCN